MVILIHCHKLIVLLWPPVFSRVVESLKIDSLKKISFSLAGGLFTQVHFNYTGELEFLTLKLRWRLDGSRVVCLYQELLHEFRLHFLNHVHLESH